ncbi:M23 family metallopeptidase [Waterburya agarophytonicola K14]|uniref:M23 family metallopeptidase n=1 Tax=Waterburya agarophytonicola KI4 TaxID=2874699 RepID=A0A964BRZ0_9CYAN|nr:M23 family metallopeptidase [Waterburya agarophytonicola]MCC0177697.1 M23 family metallopeptidase [Waterburya agarophytonicola KI4]
MSYRPIIRWNRWLTIAIATVLISLGFHSWRNPQSIASDIPEQILLAQDVSAVWQKGSFPVENFQSYTSPFGYRASPVNGQRQFHNGLDLAAPRGSYIRNWWGGKITDLSDDTACGTSITVQSGAWTHSYCHMEGYVENNPNGRFLLDRDAGIQIALGQDIPAGARIGRIGMTGRTTGPHLHWVLKYNGSYIDPASVLREMFKGQTVSSAS